MLYCRSPGTGVATWTKHLIWISHMSPVSSLTKCAYVRICVYVHMCVCVYVCTSVIHSCLCMNDLWTFVLAHVTIILDGNSYVP